MQISRTDRSENRPGIGARCVARLPLRVAHRAHGAVIDVMRGDRRGLDGTRGIGNAIPAEAYKRTVNGNPTPESGSAARTSGSASLSAASLGAASSQTASLFAAELSCRRPHPYRLHLSALGCYRHHRTANCLVPGDSVIDPNDGR